MINAALGAVRRSTPSGVTPGIMPLMSVGWVSAEDNRLKLKLVIDSVDPSSWASVARVVRRAAGEETTCEEEPPQLREGGASVEMVFHFRLGRSDTAGRLAAALLRFATDLSRSHVAAVLMGNYEVSTCPKVRDTLLCQCALVPEGPPLPAVLTPGSVSFASR